MLIRNAKGFLHMRHITSCSNLVLTIVLVFFFPINNDSAVSFGLPSASAQVGTHHVGNPCQTTSDCAAPDADCVSVSFGVHGDAGIHGVCGKAECTSANDSFAHGHICLKDTDCDHLYPSDPSGSHYCLVGMDPVDSPTVYVGRCGYSGVCSTGAATPYYPRWQPAGTGGR